MKTHLLCFFAICIVLARPTALAQPGSEYFKTGFDGKAEVTLFNVNTATLFDRGSAFVNSSFINGAMNVSEYSGNLTFGHSMEIPYPNDLKTKLTLVFNANASHAYFEDFVGRYNTASQEVDWLTTGATVRDNSIGAACWVFGINGIALQTTNFEKNFYLGSTDDPTQEDPSGYYFTGTQVPLLATGYQYTNDVSFPWNNPERKKLENVSPGDPLPYVTVTDKIQIMNSEGSVLTLVNPTSRSNSNCYDTTQWDYHLTGVYFDSDEKSNGYAIAKWINNVYELRRIWYKPGDGLTYYFEEEYPTYQNLGSWSAWGGRRTNRPKIAYLRYVQSQNGDRIMFSYDYQNVFGTNVTRGRKFLKSIQYYRNGAPVAGTAITFTYLKNANYTYQINVQNALSGESYTIGLNNYSPANDVGFDNIARNSTVTTTNIMEVSSITNDNNPNKTVSFTYDNHVRRYTYGSFTWRNYEAGILYGCDRVPPIAIEGRYWLEYPTKTLTSREIYHGEKDSLIYWVTTQLDGTPLYDTTSSFSVADAWWNWNSPCPAVIKPWEYSAHKGYYINVYLNNPDASYKYYRYTSDSYYWQLYLSGYHYGNMNCSVRDNYTSLMLKTATRKIYNDRTGGFDPVSQLDYSFSWGHTLYSNPDGLFVPAIPFLAYSNQQYSDISPRITNIITTITTTNLTAEQNSSPHSYVAKKNFELLRKISKLRKRNRDILIPPNVCTETRIDTESVYDGTSTLLQSVAYNYNDNVTQNFSPVNNSSYLFYYEPYSPNDLSLASEVISHNGVPKATVYSTQTINTFGHTLGGNPANGFWADSCIVKNLMEDILTTSETYRQASLAESAKKDGKFTSSYGVTSSTNYTDTNYIYRPTLPTEELAYVQKGISGEFNRKSRTVNVYSQTNPVNYGKLIQLTTYGATDNRPVTTSYIYDSTGGHAGYLRKILYDNGSDIRYVYNTEVAPSGKLFCSNGTTISNPYVSWSSAFQAQPFEMIKEYDGKSLTTFTAYDGKSNVFFSVDENGYYSANYYDGLGRITKQLKPGNFNPNNPYLPLNASSAPQGSMIATYTDSLWTPQVTTTLFRDNVGTGIQALSKFRPDSLAYETYSIDGGLQVLKSREKANYLGQKWYSQDGDNVLAYYYYDALLNLRQTRFADSSSSAPAVQQTVDYNGAQSYFKRVKLTDENGNYGYSYYDLYGKILKSERYLGTKVLTTAFSYDNLGRLQTVSTPENKTTSHTYDVRGNDSVRTTPNAGTTRFLYDKYGNVRFILDANHAGTPNTGSFNQSGASNNSGSFTLTMPAMVTISVALYAGSPSGTMRITKDGATLCSATTSSGTVAKTISLPKGTFGWSFTMTVQYSGYYGYSVDCSKANEFIYNKYDGLNRLIETGEYQMNSTADFTQAHADTASFPMSNTLVTKKFVYDISSGNPLASGQRNVIGKLSETDAYRMGQLCNQTFYSYDELGRVEWEVQSGLGNYAKQLCYWYDLQGNITKKKYADLQGNANMYTYYDYDQQGRLLRVWTDTSSNGTQKVKEGEYSYYPSNRIQQLKLGATPAQTVDYSYNNRGWLARINDPDAMGSDKFAMILGYDAWNKVATAFPFSPQKNGNISWVAYRMAGVSNTFNSPYYGPVSTDYIGRVFTYDSTNRLRSAPLGYQYGSYWFGNGNYYTESYSYSDDGNFSTLTRSNSGGSAIDNLTYSYTSGTDKLASITNTVGTGSTYSYDSNGNVVSDSRTGVAFTLYDINNLPIKIYKANGDTVIFAYDINGFRVRKYGSGGADTYYLNDSEGNTELVQKGAYNNVYTYNIYGTENIGQVLRNGSSLSRFYYLKDHLGTVKMTIDASCNVTSYDDYYPFGMIMDGRSANLGQGDTRYKFTEKERDVESLYDYFGARYYDARIGRFLTVDPLAEKYPGWSPFVYVAANPLRFVDAHGDSVSLLTRGAGGSDWAGHPTSISMFGHAALNIDGKLYSYEGDGVLRIRKYDEYVKGETENVAPIVEQTLRVNQEKVQDALDQLVSDPGPYDRVSHSCTNLTMDVLAKGGIEFQEPNGTVTPLMLRNGLEGSNYVTNTAKMGSGFTLSSIGGQLMRGVALLLLDMGLSPMDKLSTRPILRGETWER